MKNCLPKEATLEKSNSTFLTTFFCIFKTTTNIDQKAVVPSMQLSKTDWTTKK